MSQDVNTNHRNSDSQPDQVPLQPWSAESYANNLMDDLFSDLDRMLEGSSKLPTETAKPETAKSEPISLQPIKVQQISMPPAVMSRDEQLTVPGDAGSSSPVPTTLQDSTLANPAAPNPQNRRSGKPFNKLLLFAALGSVILALILWLASQGKFNGLLSSLKPEAKPTPTNAQLNNADAQFINYMLRSLEVIDRKAAVNKKQATTPQQSQTSSSPSLPAAPSNNVVQGSNRGGPTVLERVYIPVYQPPQTRYIPPNFSVPPTPKAAKPYTVPRAAKPYTVPTAVKPQRSPQAAIAPRALQAAIAPRALQAAIAPRALQAAIAPRSLQAIPLPPPKPATLPQGSPVATVPLRPPAPPSPRRSLVASASITPKPLQPKPGKAIPAPVAVAPRPTAVPNAVATPVTRPSPSQTIEQAAASNPAVETKHTLVGLLELGDNSAALFDIGGVTQRIQVGQGIGSSGWALVNVANQEAMIRRNGEVRSIYVGQKF
jgi:hypothetical protein